MSTSRTLKYVTGGLEAFLGIPLLGGLFVISFMYVPLLVMLVLHMITLVISNQENTDKTGSILGIVTSCIAWIPFVGMVMHILTAVFLLLSASKRSGY